MYTHTVTDADLNAHAEELMAAASEYQLPHLHEKCEMYLCWKMQVRASCHALEAFTNSLSLHRRRTTRLKHSLTPSLCTDGAPLTFTNSLPSAQTAHHSLNIPSLLVTSDLHRALALKEMCFESIFIRGTSVLLDASFNNMPQPLLLELLRDFATRRTVRTQFLAAEEQPDGVGAPGKKRRAGA
jgi:hypothetical protein